MLFKFEGMNSIGSEIKDEIEAPSKAAALELIKQMGYFPTKISQSKAKPKAKPKKKTPDGYSGVSGVPGSGYSGYSGDANYPSSGYDEPEVPKNNFFQLAGMDSHQAFLHGIYMGIVGVIAIEVLGLLLWLIMR